MEESMIKDKITKAMKIVQDIDPDYRSQAFGEVLRVLLSTEETILPSSSSTRQPFYMPAHDPISFLRDKNADSHSDRVLAMAYFLEKFEGKEGFTVAEMKEMFVRCRVKEPANLFDIISKQEKKALLKVKGEREGVKVYVLALEGIDHVDRLPHAGH